MLPQLARRAPQDRFALNAYRLDEYGLSVETLEPIFAEYLDTFDIELEGTPVEFVNVMSNEITIVGSMGYPDEIFEVTTDLVANWEKYALIVSHTTPFDNVGEALGLAHTPGAADKVVVTFE